MPLQEWFAIFRAGKHRASNGVEREFSAEDLDAIVARYEKQTPSPCVITHQELYSPFAYAHVSDVRRNGEMLEARCDPETIEPQFAKLVEEGRLYARSVQLLPEDGSGWRLGHVAFLGAEPPAVDGLQPIAFGAKGLTFESDEAWEQVRDKRSMARMWSAVRQLAKKVFGDEEADRIVNQWEVDGAHEEVGAATEKAHQQDQGGMNMSGTATEVNAEQVKADAEKLKTQKANLVKRETEFARKQAEVSVKALLDAGKITPALADGLAEFSVHLDAGAAIAGGKIEFSRGGEKVKIRPSEHLFALLDSLPGGKTPLGGEIAGGKGAAADLGDARSIRDRALEFQAEQARKGIRVTAAAAVAQVTGKIPA